MKNLKNKKKLLIAGAVILLAVAAAAIFFLRGRGGGEEGSLPEEPEPLPVVPAPIVYEIKDMASVVALPVGESIVVTEEIPEEPEEEEEAEAESEEESSEEDASTGDASAGDSSTEELSEELSEEERAAAAAEKLAELTTVLVTYHYQGLKEPLERLGSYCDLLTAEDFGFVPIDVNRMKTKMKPVEGESGSLQLVREIGSGEEEAAENEEKQMLSLTIGWNPEECYVTVAQIDGGIVPPPKREPLTLSQAVDYFYKQKPADLGLSGVSMREYQVFALDGAVMVDGIPCLRMNVYSKDPDTNTNVIAGQYLMSGDGVQLYFMDGDGVVHDLRE